MTSSLCTIRTSLRIGLFSVVGAISLASFSGCAELDSLREKTALQDQEIARLRKENADFQKAYYQTNEQRTNENTSLTDQVEVLRRELEKAKNLKTDHERQLEDQLRKQGLETDSIRVKSDAQVQKYTQDLEQTNESLAKSQQEAVDVKTKLVELQSTQDKDQKKIQALDAQTNDLQAKLKGAEAAKGESDKKIQAAEKAAADLRAQNDADKKKLETAAAEIEKLKADQGSAKNAAAGMDALKKENEKLKADMAAAKEAKEKSAAEAPVDAKNDPALAEAAKKLGSKLSGMDQGSKITTKLDSRGLRVIIPSDFAFNRGTVLLSDPVKPLLTAIAGEITTLGGGRKVRVEGHTDDQPTIDLPFADNWGLGSARADKVRQFLTNEAKLDGGQLELVTRASSDPVAKNTTAEGRAQNRRVEIVIGVAGK